MTTVRHLVWKDTRRLAPWLFVWWALAALLAVTQAGATPTAGMPELVVGGLIARAWSFTSVVLFIVIVCMIFMYLWPGMTLWLPNYLYGG